MLPRGISDGSISAYLEKPGDGGVDVFFFGRMKYADIFGSRHTTGFGLKFDSIEKIWLVTGGGTYNYDRTERDPTEGA
ncbi:MAG TPA: hypothetical protein VGP86_13850 [Xanthobacteraceae bacterium]|nr:hypothetical protein [Xanthobacteraceae bacterium]